MKHTKPIELHLLDGKKHFGKAEIEERKRAEIRLGDQSFVMPDTLSGDSVAKKKWDEIIALYTEYDVKFVSTSDVGILERYCLAHSEYCKLQAVRREVEKQGREIKAGIVGTYKKIDELRLENAINRKAEILLSMEGHLFLTPLSKIRTVAPQKDKGVQTPAEKAGFGNV